MPRSAFVVKRVDPEKWRRVGQIGPKAVPRAMELTATEFWRNVAQEVPVDTGRLAGSFSVERRSDTEFAVISSAKYAAYVLHGTAPHVIRPRTKQALWWPGAAHPVRRVNHPGTEPNPFVDRAWSRTEGRIEEFGRRALKEAERGF